METPAIRPLEIVPIVHEGQQLIVVQDPIGVIEGMAVLPPDPVIITILQTANGERTIDEIAEIARENTGLIVTSDKVMNYLREMDNVGMLLSESFLAKLAERKATFAKEPIRKSTLFNSDDKLLLLKEMGEEFRRHELRDNAPPDRIELPPGRVAGILAPHIDYVRGGPLYLWSHRALQQTGGADTYIILGTLHKPSTHPFIATKKSFETPLGTVEVDIELMQKFEDSFDGELYDDEIMHADEHTIEIQVAYLQHILKDKPFKILPILVGSFEPYLFAEPKMYPVDDEEIEGFTKAIQALLASQDKSVALIGSVDFAHCGPEFGDQTLNSPEIESAIREADEQMLQAVESMDPNKFFDTFREDFNERRVCSIATVYLVMAILGESHTATRLQYDQANSDDRECMVTFGSVAFTSNDPESSKPKSSIILLD